MARELDLSAPNSATADARSSSTVTWTRGLVEGMQEVYRGSGTPSRATTFITRTGNLVPLPRWIPDRCRARCSIASTNHTHASAHNDEGPPLRAALTSKKPAASYSPRPFQAKYHRR